MDVRASGGGGPDGASLERDMDAPRMPEGAWLIGIVLIAAG
jgi:hypothetical protein